MNLMNLILLTSCALLPGCTVRDVCPDRVTIGASFDAGDAGQPRHVQSVGATLTWDLPQP